MDLRLSPLPFGGLDLEVRSGDLVMDRGLATAVVVSLWTDRRAGEDDGLGIDDDPRGYWADREGDRWGSRLWLLDRALKNDDTLRRAEDYALEGLDWLKSAGIAQDVKVQAAWNPRGWLLLTIRITRDPGPKWDGLWRGTAEDVAVAADGQSLRVLVG